MRRHGIIGGSLVCLVLLILTPAFAQQKSLKEQLVGTWTLVSLTTQRPDGSLQWGSNPKGVLIFTDTGHFSTHVMRSDRPKFASNNRLTGTAEENKRAVEGNIASFGTYTVDEDKKTFTLRYEGSSYPNLEGSTSTRPFTITGDELHVTNPAPTIGGPASQQVFKRVK
jgi:Lipocalin-like domain